MAGSKKTYSVGASFLTILIIIVVAALAFNFMNWSVKLAYWHIHEAFFHNDISESFVEKIQAAAKEQKTFDFNDDYFVKINDDSTVSCYEIGSHFDTEHPVRRMDPNPLEYWCCMQAVCIDDHYVLGLCRDGTLVYGDLTLGPNNQDEISDPENRSSITKQRDVTDIHLDYRECLALNKNGKVFHAGYGDDKDYKSWENISAIVNGMGLKDDGTVTYSGMKGFTEYSHWKNIAALRRRYSRVVGIRKDGTVKINKEYVGDMTDARDWEHIVSLDISTEYLVGVSEDGSVRFARYANTNDYPLGDEITQWKDIVTVQITNEGVVGKDKSGKFHFATEDQQKEILFDSVVNR